MKDDEKLISLPRIDTTKGLKYIGYSALILAAFRTLYAYSMLLNHSYDEYRLAYVRTNVVANTTMMALAGVIAVIAAVCLQRIEKRLDKIEKPDQR